MEREQREKHFCICSCINRRMLDCRLNDSEVLNSNRHFSYSNNRNREETTEMETIFNDESDSNDESYESAYSEGLMLNERREDNEDHVRYWQFFNALQENNWSGVDEFISRLDHQGLTAKISVYVEETLSYIITRKLDAPIWLLEKLASKMGPQSLDELKDGSGHSAISKSSSEAEYRAMASTVCELLWLIQLLQELGFTDLLRIPLHCDNQATNHIASNPIFHERTKQIDIDCHIVREQLKLGVITTAYIPSSEQPADLLTKALVSPLHSRLLSKLGVLDLYHPPT